MKNIKILKASYYVCLILIIIMLSLIVFDSSPIIISVLSFILLMAIYLLYRQTYRFFNHAIISVRGVENGQWPEQVDPEKNEFSSLLYHIHQKNQEVINYLKQINDGNFEFEHLDETDLTRQSLIELKEAQQSHLAKEDKRHWKTEGLAKFGEVLRNNNHDLKELSFQVLSNLVTYVNANQGSFFIEEADGDSRYMELTACYAYQRKKFIEQRIECGQGLIGQVMLEKDTIYLTDVPSDFVKITSGLGEAVPTNIIILPLMVNEQFYGAIELASFTLFDQHQREFLEEVCVIIASAIASVKVNQHTQALLEESQSLTAELSTKEEEMRQNMEELQATQEEMQRGKAELDGVFGALNATQGLVEFTPERSLLLANSWIENTLGQSSDQIKNDPSQLLPVNTEKVWPQLLCGQAIEQELLLKIDSGELWLNVIFSPIFNKNDELDKILALYTNITRRKQREKEFERLSLVADNTDNAVIITDENGLVEYVNKGFEEMSGYTLNEMLGKKPGHILQGRDTDTKTISRIRQKVNVGEPLYEEILNYSKDGQAYWVSLAINPVRNELGEIMKFIAVQANITETKKAALEYQYKLEAIDRSNAIVEFDLNGHILTANNNFLKMIGYTLPEIQGKHHKMFVTEEERNTAAYQQFWQRLAKGAFINDEFKRLHKDGSEIWLRGIYNPMLDMNGEPVKIIKFATDTTKEKLLSIQTENQTKELSSQLETINKTIATIEFDKDRRIISANNVYLDIAGYKESELKGQVYEFLLPQSEADKPQHTMMWDSLLNGHFFTGQFRQKSKSGQDLWLLGTFNPLMDKNGKLESIKMFAQFNTHDKEKEINMSQVISAFQKTVPVIELDPSGKCGKGNDIFYQTFETSRMKLRGIYFNEFFQTDFAESDLLEIISEINSDKMVEETISHVSDNGTVRIYRAVFNPIMNYKQELSRIMVVLIDKEVILNVSN